MNDFINYIPEILLYIVPGYIVQRIIETFTSRKQLEQFHTILWSLFYSFVVAIMVSILKWLYVASNINLPFLANMDVRNTIKTIAYIVCSFFLGFIITKCTNSGFGVKVVNSFNPNMEPGEDVWIKTLSESNGAWVRVFMKDGMVYYGALRYHTCNPDDPRRFIVLSAFRFGPAHEKQNMRNGRIYTPLEDHTSDIGVSGAAKVIINVDDIAAIQINP